MINVTIIQNEIAFLPKLALLVTSSKGNVFVWGKLHDHSNHVLILQTSVASS